jgi:hypothetical protein
MLSRHRETALVLCVVVCLLAASAGSAIAQTAEVIALPPNIILPNYLSVPSGPYGGLESAATVARTSDPSSAWFNPAGLSRAAGTEITGSAGLYQLTTVSPAPFPQDGGSAQQLPNLVGFTIRTSPTLTLGFALVTTNSWVQETNSQIVVRTAPLQERYSYSADSELSRRVAALSAGYSRGGTWRFGGGLAISFSDLREVQTVTDREADSSALRTLMVSSRVGGSALQMRPVLGAQIDLSPSWQAGVMFRAPGFTVRRTGTAVLEGTLGGESGSLGTSFFDPDARFDQKLPSEVHAGLAFLGERIAIEFDVQAYTSIDAYPLISSDEPVLVYTDGPAMAPIVTSSPYPGLISASRGFANVAVGGHYLLSPSRSMRLHFGVASDLSPVADADQIYARANLLAWTAGLSGSVGRFTFSGGIDVRTGSADNIVLRNLIVGETVAPDIDVRTIGLIYALAYRF